MPSDILTVLTSLDSKPAKTFGLKDGRIVLINADKPFKFDCKEVPVGSLEDLATVLGNIQTDSQKVVIRGELCDPESRSDIRRTKENFEAAGRQWCMIDIDDLPLPEAYQDFNSHKEQIIGHAIAQLPAEFQRVECWYQFSASMGVKPGIRVHLWYWLGRQVSDAEMKAWLGDSPVDLSLFNPFQMHFTAKPIFLAGAVDPLPDRSGIFQAGGGLDTVSIPHDLDQRVVSRSSRPRHVRTGGHVESQEIIRDPETDKAIDGRERLMFELSNEVTSELVRAHSQSGVTVDMITDRLWEMFQEEADLSGDRWTKERAKEKAEARHRELTEGTYSFTSRADSTTLIPTETPYYQTRLTDSTNGKIALVLALDRFFDAVAVGEIPRQMIRITMGAGKSTRTLKKLKQYLSTASNQLVEIYVPRHEIAEEFVDGLASQENGAEVVNARVIHVKPRTGGQVSEDGTRKFDPLCKRFEYVEKLENNGVSVFPNACSQKGVTCDYFTSCDYLNQFREPMIDTHNGNIIRIYMHAHLGLPRNIYEEERSPEIVIVDEGFLNNLLDEKTISDLSLVRTHLKTDSMPKIGDLVVDSLINDRPVLAKLRQYGVNYADLAAIDLSALRPDVAFSQSQSTPLAVGSASAYNTLSSLLLVLKEEWNLGNRDTVERLVYDAGKGAIHVCRLKNNRVPDDCAALFLDATANKTITEKLVGQLEFKSIDIAQKAFVTQVHDRTGSNKWWNDHPDQIQLLVDVVSNWAEYEESPLCVSHKALAEQIADHDELDSRVKVMHFKALRGSNEAENSKVVFITGRNQPPAPSMDRQARAVFWNDPIPLQHDDLNDLPLQLRGYLQSEANPATQSGVYVRSFSDPRVEAIHNQEREAETVQAVARLRLVYAQTMKRVFLLGNLPVEMPVDRLVSFNELMPDRLEQELKRCGNLPISAMGLVKMRPDLARDRTAANNLLRSSMVRNPEMLLRLYPALDRQSVMVAKFKAGDVNKTWQEHLFIPRLASIDSEDGYDLAIHNLPKYSEIAELLTTGGGLEGAMGWGDIEKLTVNHF